MKSLLVKLGVILIGLAIFGYAEVWGADWKHYGDDEKFSAYYDVQSITRPSKNIVRVWLRWDWTEKGVMVMVGDFGKKYENLSHSIDLHEINCVEKTIHSLSLTAYDNKRGVIYSSSSPLKWDSIVPGSIIEILYKKVCK
jgi:hypothetical protein